MRRTTLPPARLRPPARHRRSAPRHRRRARRRPVAAGLLAALALGGTTAMAANALPVPAERQAVLAPAAPPSATGAGASAGGRGWGRLASMDESTSPEWAAAPGSAGAIWVNYPFDGGPDAPIVDTTGRNPLRQQVAAGGRVTFVRHGSGSALRFPARCAKSSPRCPRAILEGATGLNPGVRPLRYGASVLIAPDETAAGANVLQKGYAVGATTQFKLQVDGTAGRPSCVVASTTRVYRAIAPVTVADGAWHQLSCARSAGRLTISVDGTVRGSVAVPESLSIVNNQPLRLGGKNALPNNDQFAGQIDDAYVGID